MSFINGLNEPKDLLLKLIREGNRVNFEKDETNTIDHFFNFSVTAHSLRDWCIKYLNAQSNKKQLNQVWDNEPALIIAKDIANSVKHFSITYYTPSISKSTPGQADFIEFRSNENVQSKLDKTLNDKSYREAESEPKISFEIEFSDGSKISLDDYIFKTITYWLNYFDTNSIPRHQGYGNHLIFVNRQMWSNFI